MKSKPNFDQNFLLRLFSIITIFTYAFSTKSENLSGIRIDQAQVIGTHNSYHVAPHPSLSKLIRATNEEFGDALEYTHRPLIEQFEKLGIRQIELDLYADPIGGHYSNPKGVGVARTAGLPDVPNFDPDSKLATPGLKILHTPDIDYQTTVLTFKDALLLIQEWSDANPSHFPLTILIELKETPSGPLLTKSIKFTEERILDVEKEILDVMNKSDIITPQLVRGEYKTLREAVLNKGWPLLADSRGKVIFCLDNTGKHRDIYLKNDPNLHSRLLFPSVDESHPAAGFFKVNDPIQNFNKIQSLVSKGFMVRTRADIPTKNARTNNTVQREKAFASGAQLISTDYPEPNPSFSLYSVRFPGHKIAISNPVSGNKLWNEFDLEKDLIKFSNSPPKDIGEYLSRMAFKAHNKRALSEASAYYKKLLELDPAENLTEVEKNLIISVAPDLLKIKDEPFILRDAIAVHHPTKPIIAYHLMWGDDIDFPADNDPVDHEVVWVSYSIDSLKPTFIHTYFHGQILTIKAPQEPLIGIEWGKHGSIPLLENNQISKGLSGLKKNWQRLNERGIRKPKHPFSNQWPKKFPGTFEDYLEFKHPENLVKHLKSKNMMIKGKWANAIIDQIFLPYNFSAKMEWPDSFY